MGNITKKIMHDISRRQVGAATSQKLNSMKRVGGQIERLSKVKYQQQHSTTLTVKMETL